MLQLITTLWPANVSPPQPPSRDTTRRGNWGDSPIYHLHAQSPPPFAPQISTFRCKSVPQNWPSGPGKAKPHLPVRNSEVPCFRSFAHYLLGHAVGKSFRGIRKVSTGPSKAQPPPPPSPCSHSKWHGHLCGSTKSPGRAPAARQGSRVRAPPPLQPHRALTT